MRRDPTNSAQSPARADATPDPYRISQHLLEDDDVEPAVEFLPTSRKWPTRVKPQASRRPMLACDSLQHTPARNVVIAAAIGPWSLNEGDRHSWFEREGPIAVGRGDTSKVVRGSAGGSQGVFGGAGG